MKGKELAVRLTLMDEALADHDTNSSRPRSGAGFSARPFSPSLN